MIDFAESNNSLPGLNEAAYDVLFLPFRQWRLTSPGGEYESKTRLETNTFTRPKTLNPGDGHAMSSIDPSSLAKRIWADVTESMPSAESAPMHYEKPNQLYEGQ
jgi:hypothetical protein